MKSVTLLVLFLAGCLAENTPMVTKEFCATLTPCLALYYIPHCGSDGKTYGNDCLFAHAQCNSKLLGVNLQLVAKSRCEDVAVKPKPSKCDKACYEIYQPHCGSDGITYDNDCYFGIAQCKARERGDTLTLTGLNRCEQMMEDDTPTKCIQMCPAVYSPVCGSDGKTYSNKCILGSASCRSREQGGKDITIASNGKCSPKCAEYPCPPVYQPMCASDGVTYGSKCIFEQAQCRAKLAGNKLQLVAKSRCEDLPSTSKPNSTCDKVCYDLYQPHCGSDGVTYDNDCYFGVAQCKARERGYSLKLYGIKRCERNCRQMCGAVYDPVCGSDGKTYSNDCQLKSASCRGRNGIKVLYKGKCQPNCEEMGSSVEYQPVCGSDGVTYGNTCALKIAQCFAKRDGNVVLTMAYKGECVASYDAVAMEETCIKYCPRIYKPVCASDGKTYSNECFMEQAECEGQKSNPGLNISKVYDGMCSGGNCQYKCDREKYAPVCGSDGKTYPNKCSFEYQKCVHTLTNPDELTIKSNGKCVDVSDLCSRNCSLAINDGPVCATDGNQQKTFQNYCTFLRTQCYYENFGGKLRLSFVKNDTCEPPATKTPLERCERFCFRLYKPLCGEDNVTYTNMCFFEVAQCKLKVQTNETLRIKHDGTCESMGTTKAPPTKTPQQLCNKFCFSTYKPVCGTDGITYKNQCKLQIAQCIAKFSSTKLAQKHTGTCESMGTTKAPPTKTPQQLCYKFCFSTYKPVCGTDGITYKNQCKLQIAQCIAKFNSTKLAQRHTGTCESMGTTTAPPTKSPAQLCNRFCSWLYQPVCGSNGRTYSNKCVFEKAQCMSKLTGKSLTLEYKGQCKKVTLTTRRAVTYSTPLVVDNQCKRMCGTVVSPMCGSDGITYNNVCEFMEAECESRLKGKPIYLKSSGSCKTM